MRPDDAGLGIVTEQDEQRLFVAMRVQIEIPLDREIDHLLDPIVLRRLSVNVEFADAAVVAARVFALDQFEDRRIVEPGLDVAAHAIGPDERHHFQLGPLGIDELDACPCSAGWSPRCR